MPRTELFYARARRSLSGRPFTPFAAACPAVLLRESHLCTLHLPPTAPAGGDIRPAAHTRVAPARGGCRLRAERSSGTPACPKLQLAVAHACSYSSSISCATTSHTTILCRLFRSARPYSLRAMLCPPVGATRIRSGAHSLSCVNAPLAHSFSREAELRVLLQEPGKLASWHAVLLAGQQHW